MLTLKIEIKTAFAWQLAYLKGKVFPIAGLKRKYDLLTE